MMIFGIISILLVLGLTGILFWSDYRMYQTTQLPEDTEFNERYGPAPNEYPGEMIDVESCTPIYAVGWWAHPGLRTFYFTGEYNDKREPLVWYFNDHNGFYESWRAVPIQATTTGRILAWSFDKEKMVAALEALEQQEQDRG